MIPESCIANEKEFFDQEAAALTDEDLLLPVHRVERYRLARPSAFNIAEDALYAHMQPIEGKKVLDYGCGHGEHSAVLAACGAHVTAFDLSPLAVTKARRRTELNGLEDRIQCDVRKAGQTGYAPASFDVVLASAILHHLHGHLPAIYEEIAHLLKPGGYGIFYRTRS